MTTEQFTYWLQGFAEIHTEAPTQEQWQIIKDHLKLVFDKRTPDRLPPSTFPFPVTTPNIDFPKNPYGPTVIC